MVNVPRAIAVLCASFFACGVCLAQPGGESLAHLKVPAELVVKKGATAMLRVTAVWQDGRQEDVTDKAKLHVRDDSDGLAVSESGLLNATIPGRYLVSASLLNRGAVTIVTVPFSGNGEVLAAKWRAFTSTNFIDSFALRSWKKARLAPAKPANDWVFARRANLHLIGKTPTPRELRRFVASREADKRSRLIDALLARPEYADHWAAMWSLWLTEGDHALKLDKGQGRAVMDWLRESMAENQPLDGLARAALRASGDLARNGPAVFYAARPKPQAAAAAFSGLFLDVSAQCAQCHTPAGHSLGEDDHLALAACFAGVSVEKQNGETTLVRFEENARFLHPKTGQPVAPAVMGRKLPASPHPRESLARWLSAEGGMHFARAIVGRYWSFLLGASGDEVDPRFGTAPVLLPGVREALARDFLQHGFDAKRLLRTICRSSLYQLSQEAGDPGRRTAKLHASFPPRRIPLHIVAGMMRQAARSEKIAMAEFPFLSMYRYPYASFRVRPVCPREPNMAAPLSPLSGGDDMAKAIGDPRGRVAGLIAAGRSHARIVEEICLATLSRPPNEKEIAAIEQHRKKCIADHGDNRHARRVCYEDVTWALINTKEFLFFH